MPDHADKPAPPTEPRLRVRLLGAPAWQRGDDPPVPLAAKDAALIAKLALDGPQPRAALCELLWPASTPSQAGASLRQRASRLRGAAGGPFIELGDRVELHAGVRVDAAQAELSPDDLMRSGTTLLAGVDLGDHDALDRWLAQARLRVADRCALPLADRAEALERAGRLHEALPWAQRVVDATPLSEQGWRRLMRLHYLRGDRAAAQEAYWRLHGLLRDELGTRPSAETQQLQQTIELAAQGPMLPRQPVPVSLMRPPLLIGRQPAWAAMAGAWQRPQPFLLVGEGGIGKSRLLEEFLHGQADGLVIERARPGDQPSPHALLGRLLRQVDERFAPPAEAAQRAELARLHPGFGTPPAAAAHAGMLRQALERWLAAAMQAGLRALVVDDLHDADLASLEALRWLAASPLLQPLRLGLATRPCAAEHPCGPLLQAWLADSQRLVRIDLPPLTQAELRALLASLALPALLDASLAQRLYRHAGGQPLYTLATLQHAAARGGQWQPEAVADGTPDAVQALLDARLHALPADTAALLQVAAVGGADLTVDRAARLLGTRPLALSPTWATLEAHDVLRGEAFSHDLVRDAALRAVPQGLRQSLHRQWAALLRDEGSALPARVAAHWEQGQRPADAGPAWQAAAEAARRGGRLAEQTDFYERAARCHAEAGDTGARVDALCARLDGLHLQRGAAAVLQALPEIEALADTTRRRLRCRIARTEALLDLGRADEAADEARRAADDLHADPDQAVVVHAQQAIALAQCRRDDDALAEAGKAMALAQDAATPAGLLKTLKAANALMYVHWSAGRLIDAVAAQRNELAAAEALGDRATAAASQGSMAALLAAAGDVPGTHAQALQARTRLQEVGAADTGTPVILNHTVLGAAAAALGRFDDALHSLQLAVALAGADAAPAVRAKAMLTLAHVWLTMGRADAAQALLRLVEDEPPADLGPGMRLQALWLAARAAEQAGESAAQHWARFEAQADAQRDLPLVQGVVFEASYVGPAPQAITALAAARAQCEALGLAGTARALAWRELMRWLEQPGDTPARQALRLAEGLVAHADSGLSAKCHPPHTWLGLAEAFGRAGDAARQAVCMEAGHRWLATALARMAPEHRADFSQRHPVHRAMLAPRA